MNIHFLEKKGQKLISCNFIIPIGMNCTWKDNRSFAHLVEHLLFKAHPRLTQYGLMQEIEKLGGIMNALTDVAHTEIFIRVEERYLTDVVALIWEAINVFDISENDIEREAEIIELEETQSYVEEFVFNCILNVSNIKKTGKFCKDELKEIYQTYYGEENWILLLVGDVSEESKEQLEKYATNKVDKVAVRTEFLLPNSPKYECIQIGDETHFVYYHPCTVLCNKMDMKIVKYLLTSGLSSYFYEPLVAEKGYTYQIIFQDVYYDRAAFVIFFACDKEAEADIRTIFENVFSKPNFICSLENEKIRRAINMTITEYRLKAESLSSVVKDKIASLLIGTKFMDFEEIISVLSQQTEIEVRKRIERLLFVD